MQQLIEIDSGNGVKVACESVIVVPEKALEEGGYIKTFTVRESGHAKHEYHTMAQMAYYQYQDEELTVQETPDSIIIKTPAEEVVLDTGLVIYRLPGGEFAVMVAGMVNKKKMLEAANRYCTRWVRLDI